MAIIGVEKFDKPRYACSISSSKRSRSTTIAATSSFLNTYCTQNKAPYLNVPTALPTELPTLTQVSFKKTILPLPNAFDLFQRPR